MRPSLHDKAQRQMDREGAMELPISSDIVPDPDHRESRHTPDAKVHRLTTSPV